MERSKFNYFFDREGLVIGYNARTGNISLMTPAVAAVLKGQGSLDQLSFQEELRDLGFLHSGDELHQIAARYNKQKSGLFPIHLALLPTIQCNLACEYCFQREFHHNSSMSEDVIDGIACFAEHLCKDGHSRFLVSWYGSEPLLAADCVLSLTKKLQAVFDTHNVVAEFSLISNGTLLTAEMARSLLEAGIGQAQISVDALYERGIERRGVLAADGSLSRIIKNAVAASKIINITVRVNVNKNNARELNRIVNTLKQNDLSNISFARTHDFSTDCGINRNISNPSTLKVREYARLEDDQLLNSKDALPIMLRRLQPKSHYCGATFGSMLVIDHKGDVTRCWETVGDPKQIIGNITGKRDGIMCSDPAGWLNYSPLDRAACRACPALPLCMGSCANPIVALGGAHSPCDSIRYNVTKCFEAVAACLEISDDQRLAVCG